MVIAGQEYDPFLSTPSGWRATSLRVDERGLWDFYPRPPGGGRQALQGIHAKKPAISIHALRVEGDQMPRVRS